MSHRQVSADASIRWITQGLGVVRQNPLPFLAMGAMVGVLGMLPLINLLALGIFGPALYAGIAYAAREQNAGRAADFQHLFAGFTLPDKLGRLVLLCLPSIGAFFVMMFLAVILLGSTLAAIGAGADQAEALAGAGGGLLLFIVLAIAIGIGSYALVFFAMPRVILTDIDAFTAMADSLRACLANLGAFLLFVAAIIGGVLMVSLITGLLLGWLSMLLSQLLTMALTVPVVSASLYFAFVDVFGAAAGDAPQATAGIEV